MKYWPVPDSYSKKPPASGSPGCFWENRNDRYHCGVDLYAPEKSDVVSIEDGKVIDVGTFTSPERVSYWNTTYFVLVKNKNNLLFKYAELGDIKVKAGDFIENGQLIGHIGMILNPDKITRNSPPYIQKINEKGNQSMLHFELCMNDLTEQDRYLGGNWFGEERPENLLNPGDYLNSTL